MYTMVIADDAQELRDMIVNTVHWDEIGFEVVGQAENGIEALELVEKLNPDLLLTDIKMPYVSGVELARRAREIRPAMQIAFLSGYEEFSYAMEAIRYRIVSYILKPISLSEFTEEMERIKQKIDAEFARFSQAGEERTKGKDIRFDTEAQKTQNFLMPLILSGEQFSGEESSKRARETARICGMETGEDVLYAVIVTSLTGKEKGVITSPGHVDSIQGIADKYFTCRSFFASGGVVTVLSGKTNTMKSDLVIMTKEIVQWLERVSGKKCTVGIGNPYTEFSHGAKAYREAVTAGLSIEEEEEHVRFISDIERSGDFGYEYSEETSAKIEWLLKMGDKQELETYIDRIFEQINKRDVLTDEFNLLTVQIVAAVCRAVSAVGQEFFLIDEIALESPVLQDMFAFCNRQKLAGQMKQMCLRAKEVILQKRKMSTELLCEQAVEIIRTEYSDENLTLTTLSDRLHCSPTYLSAVIKRIAGNTFINLLTASRMEKAKEYLMTTAMKIFEISDKCGYSDQHYFSYCFKRYYGISPNKMRETDGKL